MKMKSEKERETKSEERIDGDEEKKGVKRWG